MKNCEYTSLKWVWSATIALRSFEMKLVDGFHLFHNQVLANLAVVLRIIAISF